MEINTISERIARQILAFRIRYYVENENILDNPKFEKEAEKITVICDYLLNGPIEVKKYQDTINSFKKSIELQFSSFINQEIVDKINIGKMYIIAKDKYEIMLTTKVEVVGKAGFVKVLKPHLPRK